MNEAAAAGEEALARGAGGAMLYDASCLHHPDTAVFDRSHWQAHGTLETTQGGRGTVAFVRTRDGQRWVLRHYRRGGLIARLGRDLYDLNDAASLTSETVGCSLMVGEMLAGLAR